MGSRFEGFWSGFRLWVSEVGKRELLKVHPALITRVPSKRPTQSTKPSGHLLHPRSPHPQSRGLTAARMRASILWDPCVIHGSARSQTRRFESAGRFLGIHIGIKNGD